MKTIFIKDLEYDAFLIWVMLKEEDPSGVANRAKIMGIDSDFLARIRGVKNYNEVKNLIEGFVKKEYERGAKDIESVIIKYQEAWDKINDIFYNEILRITETAWKFSEYKVVASLFHPGVSSRDGNIVSRWIHEDPEDQKRITAHEILMTHIWNIFDNKFPEASDDKLGHFWALNEITTTAILGLESSLNNLWSSHKKGYDNYLHNYPQLRKLQSELKGIYLNKKDFSDYLNQAINKIKKDYKDINLLVLLDDKQS